MDVSGGIFCRRGEFISLHTQSFWAVFMVILAYMPGALNLQVLKIVESKTHP